MIPILQSEYSTNTLLILETRFNRSHKRAELQQPTLYSSLLNCTLCSIRFDSRDVQYSMWARVFNESALTQQISIGCDTMRSLIYQSFILAIIHIVCCVLLAGRDDIASNSDGSPARKRTLTSASVSSSAPASASASVSAS